MLFAAHAFAQDSVRIEDAIRQLSKDPVGTAPLKQLRASIENAPESAPVALGLAVYYLGSLIAGVPEEAAWAVNQLEENHADSPYFKRVERHQLMDVCALCKGGGSQTNACRACNGSGKCNLCQGNGWNRGLNGRKNDCTICGASGVCAVCKGEGKAIQPCPACRGQGGRFSKVKTLALYDRFLDGSEFQPIAKPRESSAATELHKDVSSISEEDLWKNVPPESRPSKTASGTASKKESPPKQDPPKEQSPVVRVVTRPGTYVSLLPTGGPATTVFDTEEQAAAEVKKLNQRDEGKTRWAYRHDTIRGKYVVYPTETP